MYIVFSFILRVSIHPVHLCNIIIIIFIIIIIITIIIITINIIKFSSYYDYDIQIVPLIVIIKYLWKL